MDFLASIAEDSLRQIIPNFKHGILLNNFFIQIFIRFSIEDAFMKEVIDFGVRVSDIVAYHNCTFSIPTNQM